MRQPKRAAAPPEGGADDDTVTADDGSAPRKLRMWGKSGFRANDAYTIVTEAEHLAVGPDGDIYQYQDGVYVPDGSGPIRSRAIHRTIRAHLAQQFRPNLGRIVESMVLADPPRILDPDIGDGDIVNVSNGLLRWSTGELHAHHPDFVSVAQLPVPWEPNATSPRFDRFLREVTGDDDSLVAVLEEVLGLCIYAGTPPQLAVLLLGAGSNGKGSLIRVGKALVGAANIAAVQPRDLSNDRFAAADLYGKLANFAGDIDTGFVENTGLFKRVTGGDPIDAQRKYRDRFVFTNRALLVLSANKISSSSDSSHGYLRRWLVVPFGETFPEDDNLDAELAAELPGVLVHAVAGLRRFKVQGGFTKAERIEAAKTRFDRVVDPVREFVDTYIQPGSRVTRKAVSDLYRRWAESEGIGVLSARKFNDRLPAAVQAVYDVVLDPDSPSYIEGYPAWSGIGLRYTSPMDTSMRIVREAFPDAEDVT